MAGSKRRLPRPPHNPGVRELVEGKRAWDARPAEKDKREGFRGWHERGYVPHRDSPGLTQFVTWHLVDSFPLSLRREWSATLDIEDDRERRKELEAYLDRGRGECWLRRNDIAKICEDALLHFQGEQFQMKAWCLMPNHAHVLFEVAATPMSELVQSWKGYSAQRCNQILGRTHSAFWSDDYWDTYMRDAEHERQTIRYIENNPVKAGLAREAAQWAWSSARFRDRYGRMQLPPRTSR
jgi:REP element-mobilizing transposase RayT